MKVRYLPGIMFCLLFAVTISGCGSGNSTPVPTATSIPTLSPGPTVMVSPTPAPSLNPTITVSNPPSPTPTMTPSPTPIYSGPPDLVFTDVKITSKSASEIWYNYTIKNIGGQTIDAETMKKVAIQNIYSANTTYEADQDVPAGGGTLAFNPQIDQLEPGESYTYNFAAFVTVPTGMNYLILIIDKTKMVNEANENNNTYCVKL